MQSLRGPLKSLPRLGQPLGKMLAVLLLGLMSLPALGNSQDGPDEDIDISLIGGGLTSDLPGRFALQLPAPNIASEERRLTTLQGFAVFHRALGRSEGLGPRFINRSCAGCHVENGRGPIGFRKGALGESTMVVRVSQRNTPLNAEPIGIRGLGQQLLDHDLKGNSRFNLTLRWRTIRGRYPDGTKYELRRPKLQFEILRWNPRRMVYSLRMTPPVIGTGLLEAIPDEWIIEASDPDDLTGDGISGRINFVPDRRTGELAIGRFGFKATHPTVEQQSLAALFHDMGVTNSLFNPRGDTLQFAEDSLLDPLLFYQRLAGVPAPRNVEAPDVRQGLQLFAQIGCADCHRYNLHTGPHADPELAFQTIHPFTDLLLHDMGRGLSDARREFSALGREWRTTPLWGLGFASTVSAVKSRYLHDGRARTIEEAVLWHGGESLASRNRFMNLSKEDRAKVLAFLRSL